MGSRTGSQATGCRPLAVSWGQKTEGILVVTVQGDDQNRSPASECLWILLYVLIPVYPYSFKRFNLRFKSSPQDAKNLS
ncbi:hypothetical protein WJX84_007528 [Apatococcus fuscideae]|uniref:Uncharacterized protein n=1 Tax=Apatococcus fuscideae TaxID=2026836 RepID=A0AAW1T9E4_9CHLO